MLLLGIGIGLAIAAGAVAGLYGLYRLWRSLWNINV
jgi:hypothetical protein